MDGEEPWHCKRREEDEPGGSLRRIWWKEPEVKDKENVRTVSFFYFPFYFLTSFCFLARKHISSDDFVLFHDRSFPTVNKIQRNRFASSFFSVTFCLFPFLLLLLFPQLPSVFWSIQEHHTRERSHRVLIASRHESSCTLRIILQYSLIFWGGKWGTRKRKIFAVFLSRLPITPSHFF
jgi:hypothetical protein